MGKKDEKTGCNYLVPISFEVNLKGLKDRCRGFVKCKSQATRSDDLSYPLRVILVSLLVLCSGYNDKFFFPQILFFTFVSSNQLPYRTSGLTHNKSHLKTLCTPELVPNTSHAEFNKPQSHQHDFPLLRSRLPALLRHHFRDPRSPSTSPPRSQGSY
jgi:hypothetical protein